MVLSGREGGWAKRVKVGMNISLEKHSIAIWNNQDISLIRSFLGQLLQKSSGDLSKVGTKPVLI